MYESLLKNTAEYQKISASLAAPGPAALFGLPPAGRALLYAVLQKDLGRVLCIVTPGEAEATHFADDLKALGLTAAVFPPRDFMLRPVEGAGREYEYRRLSVLGALAGGRLNAVCVPAEALLQYTVPRDEFLKNTLTLKPGMVYNREALVERLFSAGYVRRSQVDGPGQFSVRGDIVDIYAPDMRQPARIEYWDDEIDSLASFDLLTQRRDGALEKIYLSPAREVLFGSTADTAEALRAAQKKARGKHRAALEKAMEADLSQLDSGLMPEAMDKYYGLRYPAPATLLDHLDSPIFVLDEVGGIRDAQKATEFRRSEELTGLLEEGVLCPGLDVLYQTMDDLVIAAQKQSTLLCENFLRGMNEFQLKALINAEAFAAPNWGGDMASLREDLDPLIAQGYAVTLFAGTPKGAAALTRDLADKGYAVSMSRDVRPAKGLVQVLPGHLTAGCTFPFARMAVISSRRHGLDEASAEAKKRKKNKNALSSLSDIKPGDYVVHQSHGIGMYAGIQRLEVQGIPQRGQRLRRKARHQQQLAVQLCRGDAAAPPERAAVGHQQGRSVPGERGAGKPGRAAAQVHHQPGVQRAVLQLCTYGVVGEQCGFQRDARVLLPELLQHIPQHGQVAGHQRHTDAQPQGGGPDILIRLRAHPVKLLHHRRGLCPEALALFGQGKVIAHIDEQRAAKFFFQCGNAQPQSLPGQIHPPGRAGIVQIFAQRQKIAQLLNGHGRFLSRNKTQVFLDTYRDIITSFSLVVNVILLTRMAKHFCHSGTKHEEKEEKGTLLWKRSLVKDF